MRKLFIYIVMALFAAILMLAPFCIKAQSINGVKLTGQTFTDISDSISINTLYCQVQTSWVSTGTYTIALIPCRSAWAAEQKSIQSLGSQYGISTMVIAGNSSTYPTLSTLETAIAAWAQQNNFTATIF